MTAPRIPRSRAEAAQRAHHNSRKYWKAIRHTDYSAILLGLGILAAFAIIAAIWGPEFAHEARWIR